ncbi:MAG: GYD domain-containing protein, partial [Candidatus Bathyarchaeota archaeon]|nr:GYD domain-containing protein [Candidatus Bathyarchaeota archaeon]
EVNKEIEAFGAKVINQYAVLGPYDFVNVVEAPDNKTIARISVELGSRGTIHMNSLPAIPIDNFIDTMKKK